MPRVCMPGVRVEYNHLVVPIYVNAEHHDGCFVRLPAPRPTKYNVNSIALQLSHKLPLRCPLQYCTCTGQFVVTPCMATGHPVASQNQTNSFVLFVFSRSLFYNHTKQVQVQGELDCLSVTTT